MAPDTLPYGPQHLASRPHPRGRPLISADHAFDTTRKAAWVADAVRDMEGVRIVAPAARWDAAATEAAIRRVHDAGYVDALPRLTRERSGGGAGGRAVAQPHSLRRAPPVLHTLSPSGTP